MKSKNVFSTLGNIKAQYSVFIWIWFYNYFVSQNILHSVQKTESLSVDQPAP